MLSKSVLAKWTSAEGLDKDVKWTENDATSICGVFDALG